MGKIENGISDYLSKQEKNPFGDIGETTFEVSFSASRKTQDIDSTYTETKEIREEFKKSKDAEVFLKEQKDSWSNCGWTLSNIQFNRLLRKILI